jgi:hypothetical protein
MGPKRLLVLSATAILCLLASAAQATTILGRWQWGPNTIAVVHRSSGLVGIEQRNGGPCPAAKGEHIWDDIRGGTNSAWTGTIPYVYTSTCQFAYNVPTTFTIASDDENMTVVSHKPDNTTDTSTAQRINTAELDSTLPILLNSFLVSFQRNYKDAEGKKAKGVFKAIASHAVAFANKAKAYKNKQPGDAKLKKCGLSAIAQVRAGALKRKRQKVGDGMRALKRCLNGYDNLFPGGTPGKPAPKPKSSKPVNPKPDTVTPYTGQGTDPNRVPRVDFDLVALASQPYLKNFHVTIRVACIDEGVFYLTAAPNDFPPQTPITVGFGDQIDIGNVRLMISGELEHGGANGRVHAVTRPGAADTCSDGGTGQIWYASAGAPHPDTGAADVFGR